MRSTGLLFVLVLAIFAVLSLTNPINSPAKQSTAERTSVETEQPLRGHERQTFDEGIASNIVPVGIHSGTSREQPFSSDLHEATGKYVEHVTSGWPNETDRACQPS